MRSCSSIDGLRSVAALLAVITACGRAPVTTSPENAAGIGMPRHELIVESGDIDLFAVAVGPPRPHHVIVGVHGGPAIVTEFFSEIELLTRHDFAVWWYLQRGVPPSSSPATQDGYQIRALAEDLEAVASRAARAHGGLGVIVVAVSWGAIPAVVAASRRNSAITGLVLVNGAPATSADLSAARIRDVERRDWARVLGEAVVDTPYEGCEEFKARPRESASVAPAGTRDHAAPRRLPACSDAAQDATYRANWDYDVSAEASAITLPVLVVRGEHDPYGGEGSMEQKLRDPTVVQLSGCGHRVLGDAPCREQLFAAIVAWRVGLPR